MLMLVAGDVSQNHKATCVLNASLLLERRVSAVSPLETLFTSSDSCCDVTDDVIVS